MASLRINNKENNTQIHSSPSKSIHSGKNNTASSNPLLPSLDKTGHKVDKNLTADSKQNALGQSLVPATPRRTVLGDKNVFERTGGLGGTAKKRGPGSALKGLEALTSNLGSAGLPTGKVAGSFSVFKKNIFPTGFPNLSSTPIAFDDNKNKTAVFLDGPMQHLQKHQQKLEDDNNDNADDDDPFNREIEFIPDPVEELPFIPYISDDEDTGAIGFAKIDYEELNRACRSTAKSNMLSTDMKNDLRNNTDTAPTPRQSSLELIKELNVDMESIPELPDLPELSDFSTTPKTQSASTIYPISRTSNRQKRILKPDSSTRIKPKINALDQQGSAPFNVSKTVARLPALGGSKFAEEPNPQLAAQIQNDLLLKNKNTTLSAVPSFMKLTASATAKISNTPSTSIHSMTNRFRRYNNVKKPGARMNELRNRQKIGALKINRQLEKPKLGYGANTLPLFDDNENKLEFGVEEEDKFTEDVDISSAILDLESGLDQELDTELDEELQQEFEKGLEADDNSLETEKDKDSSSMSLDASQSTTQEIKPLTQESEKQQQQQQHTQEIENPLNLTDTTKAQIAPSIATHLNQLNIESLGSHTSLDLDSDMDIDM